jgi:hypothetical protein
VKARALLILVVSSFAGCKHTPDKKVEAVQQNVAAAHTSPSVEPPKDTAITRDDLAAACPVLDAYPLPRSYEQILADAPRGAREPTGALEAQLVIDADGNITHLRFTRLSSLDSVNRYAVELVKKQHYKPTVVHGTRVPVCSTMSINVDLSR